MFLTLPLVLGFDMCQYYFNQRDWHMNQYCNLASALNMSANTTGETFADYSANYANRKAEVAIVTDFADVREIAETCQIYLFAINGGTLSNGIIYFNASVDVSSRACTRVQFSPFGIVTNNNAAAVQDVIITGVVNITTKAEQTTQVSNAFSYVLGASAVSGVKSNLKINVNSTEQTSVYSYFDNNTTIDTATDNDLGGLTEFTTQDGKTVKIKTDTFGTDYDALDFVQLAYHGMGAFTKMFVKKMADSNMYQFTETNLQQSQTLIQDVLVLTGNTETVAFNNTGFIICSPYDGQYDITTKICFGTNQVCSGKSIENRICMAADQECPTAYYKKDNVCYSSIDISEGQVSAQDGTITICENGKRAFDDNVCREDSQCGDGFKRFGDKGCTLECPEGNEEASGSCKIPASASECGGQKKFVDARANRPKMCLTECPSEYYEVINECKVKCDGQDVYDPKAKTCGNNCPDKYLKQEQYCVQQCSSGHVNTTTECAKIDTDTKQCPDGMFADVPMSMCVPCGVLTNAYWDRQGANYSKAKCVNTCSYYNFSQYEQNNRPAELLGKTNMFFCEQIKTTECRVYEPETQGGRQICKNTCHQRSRFLKSEEDPECITTCPENEVEYKAYMTTEKEYFCNASCDYYKAETINNFTSNSQIRNCSQCDEQGYYRHKNKDCDRDSCSKAKDSDAMFILPENTNGYYTCIEYQPDSTVCPFATLDETKTKRTCTTNCLTYRDKNETFTSQVSYKQCVNTTNSLNIQDCPQENPSYRFFSKQNENLYKCEVDCTPKMFKLDAGHNNQNICTSTCKTYYMDNNFGPDYKNCLDENVANVTKCKEVQDEHGVSKYKYLESDENSMYQCVNTCNTKYVDTDEICKDNCSTAFYRGDDTEKICLLKCDQTNETVVHGLENPRQCLAFSACTNNQKFLKRGATEADDNECVDTCADTLFFYNEYQQSETEKYYTCETSCANKKAEKQPVFGKENAHKCVERCEKAQRQVENADYTLCLDACDQNSEFLISKESQDCVKQCDTGVTYYYYNQTDNICLQNNSCSEEPYKRNVSNQINGYTECKTYCNDSNNLYKKDCNVTEDLINAQCCKPTCSEFGDSPIYYKNEKLCMKKCLKDDNTSMYAYRSNASNGKAGQCTETCDSKFYVVEGEGTEVQTMFCDDCQNGYHVEPQDHQTVLCSKKCPNEKPYAYPLTDQTRKGLCVSKCEPAQFEKRDSTEDVQKLFCTTCSSFYVEQADGQQQCYNQCPAGNEYHNHNEHKCLSKCDENMFKDEENKICYKSCPEGTYTDKTAKACVKSCTEYDVTQKFCIANCPGQKLTLSNNLNNKVVCLLKEDGTQCTGNKIALQIKETDGQITDVITSCDDTASCGELQYDNICITEPQSLDCARATDLMVELQQSIKRLPYKNGGTCVASCNNLQTDNKFVKNSECVTCDKEQYAIQKVGEEYQCMDSKECSAGQLYGTKNIFTDNYTFCSTCNGLCKECDDFKDTLAYTDGSMCVASCTDTFIDETNQQCLQNCSEGQFYTEKDGKKICKDTCDEGYGSTQEKKCITFVECKTSSLFVKKLTDQSYECVQKCNDSNFFYRDIGEYFQCEDQCEKVKKESPFSNQDMNSYKCVDECTHVFRQVTDSPQYTLCLDTCGNNEFLHQNSKQCMTECKDNITYYQQRDGNNVCQNQSGCTEKPYVKSVDSQIKTGYTECRPYCQNNDHLYDNNCQEEDETQINANCCKAQCSEFTASPYKDGLLCVEKCPKSVKYAKRNPGECVATCDNSEYEETNDANQNLFCATCNAFYVRVEDQKRCYQACPQDRPVYDAGEGVKECLENCGEKFTKGNVCYTECPTGTYTDRSNKQCATQCEYYDISQKFCSAQCNKFLQFGEKKICLDKTDEKPCDTKVLVKLTVSGDQVTGLTAECRTDNSTCGELEYDGMCVSYEGISGCQKVDQLMEQLGNKKNLIYSNEKVCVASCSGVSKFLQNGNCVDQCGNFVSKQENEWSCSDNCETNLYGTITALEKEVKLCSSCTETCSKCEEFNSSLKYTNDRECVSSCQEDKYISSELKCVNTCETQYFDDERHCLTNCSSTNNRYEEVNSMKHCKNCTKYNKDSKCIDSCKADGLYFDEASQVCIEGCDKYKNDDSAENTCVTKCSSGYISTEKVCRGKCTETYFLQTDGMKMCRNCNDSERQIDDGDGGKRCVLKCDESNPYYDDQTNACSASCPTFYGEEAASGVKYCFSTCPQKIYETKDSKDICIAACDDPRIEVASEKHTDHHECISGCPENQPYYNPKSFVCAAECSGETPYRPGSGFDTMTCTDCSSGYIYTDGADYCVSECPIGFTADDNRHCQSNDNNKGTNSWWIWLVVAIAIIVVIIVAIVVVFLLKRRRNAIIVGGAGKIDYYSKRLKKNINNDAMHNRRHMVNNDNIIAAPRLPGDQQSELPPRPVPSAPHMEAENPNSGTNTRVASNNSLGSFREISYNFSAMSQDEPSRDPRVFEPTENSVAYQQSEHPSAE